MPEPRRQTPPLPTLILIALFAVNLASRLFMALRPLDCIDGVTIPDDAYLSLKIAKNIAQGLGPWFGTGPTNGFQPLYVFLSTPLYWIWPRDLAAPVHAALALLAMADTLALFFLCRLAGQHARQRWTVVALALAWVLNPYVILTTANGLETMLAFLGITAAFDVYCRTHCDSGRAIPWRWDFGLGCLVGLAMLARIDGVFLLPALGTGMLWWEWRRGGFIKEGTARMALLGLGALVANLPWLAYSFYYTGDLLPVSGRATHYVALANLNYRISPRFCVRVMMPFAGETIWQYSKLYLQIGFALLLALPLLGGRAALAALGRRLAPWALPLALFCAAIFVGYTCYCFARWYFIRYLFPFVLPVLLGLAALADACAEACGRRVERAVLYLLLFGFLIVVPLRSPGLHYLFQSPPNTNLGYMNVGKWADGYFKPGTVVGSTQSGGLAYFAEKITVVNLDGVVNKDAYRALREKRAMDYARQAGIEYFVGWTSNFEHVVNDSQDYKPGDTTRLFMIEGVRSWNVPWYVYRIN